MNELKRISLCNSCLNSNIKEQKTWCEKSKKFVNTPEDLISCTYYISSARACLDYAKFNEQIKDIYEEVKNTKGKPPMHLILWKAVRWFIRIRVYGLKKYPRADNWKEVNPMDWYDACLRHLAAYGSGEDLDNESGLPHLAHAFCNLWYLIESTLDEANFNLSGNPTSCSEKPNNCLEEIMRNEG